MSNTLKIFLAVLALLVLPVACGIYSTFTSVATAPSRVINKTLETNNILSNYEYYKDASQAYAAKLPQIKQRLGYLAAETDPAEKVRLRTEANAIQQSCRELAAQYNSNASKLNRNLFRDPATPPELSIAACEAGA